MRISFQNIREAQQMALVHPLTLEVLELIMDDLWPKDKTLWVNEIARGPDSPDWKSWSLHCQSPPWRAMDISLKGITAEEEMLIVDGVEKVYHYDPTRPLKPVALVHAPRHLHLQTHQNTVVREP